MALYLKKKIAFRFEASKVIGYGHFMRCLSLAERLYKKYNFKIYFIVNKNFPSISLIKNKKFKILYINQKSSHEEKYILNFIDKFNINCIFFDIKKNYKPIFLKQLKIKNIKIITIDDKFNKKNYSDLCFYPPIPQVNKMNWSNFKGKRFMGWNYIPLREEFENMSRHRYLENKILIMVGGSDNKNYAFKILKKINNFNKKLNLTISLGFEAKINQKYNKIIKNSHHKILILKKKYSISKNINQSSLVISSYGVSAYEIAALQKYSILFARSKDDVMSASIFQKAKIGYIIKDPSVLSEKILEKVVKRQKKYLSKKNFKYSKLIKSGTEKIAKIINETL